MPLGTWRNVNIHDERAERLRQRIRERSLSEQADAPDREQVISRAMLDAEYRYGNASEQFAVDEEAGAVRLGDRGAAHIWQIVGERSEEHTSELQSLMRISYAVFCLHTNNNTQHCNTHTMPITCQQSNY